MTMQDEVNAMLLKTAAVSVSLGALILFAGIGVDHLLRCKAKPAPNLTGEVSRQVPIVMDKLKTCADGSKVWSVTHEDADRACTAHAKYLGR